MSGHPEGYTATDILARYRRALGYNVLHPMGWDAFGLPAEQYAIKTGQHPRKTTEQNIATFKRQIKSLGFSYDWSREIDTTDPQYFKWTQWIFLQLYNSWFNPQTNKAEPIETLPYPPELQSRAGVSPAGSTDVPPAELERKRRAYRDSKRLAYVTEAPVWWCEQLGTVLANEEVVDGKSEVGDFPVVRKPMRQWMLRITAYAERLLAGPGNHRLERFAQGNAAQLDWALGRGGSGSPSRRMAGPPSSAKLGSLWRSRSEVRPAVFTTRPDTLFGATYMVLAPEHPIAWLAEASSQPWPPGTRRIVRRRADSRIAIEQYQQVAAKKSDLERTELAKEKTGVFTGGLRHQPGERGEDTHLDRRLRAHQLRHRRHHGRAGARHARLRVRHQVQPAHRPGRRAAGRHGLARLRGRRHLSQLGQRRDLDHRPAHARSQAQDHRLAGVKGAWQEDHQLQAPRLALQPPALLGRAVPDHLEDRAGRPACITKPCPNPPCRCCRRRSTTTSPRPTASRRWRAPRTGSTCPTARSARPTPCPNGPAVAGITSATSMPE